MGWCRADLNFLCASFELTNRVNILQMVCEDDSIDEGN